MSGNIKTVGGSNSSNSITGVDIIQQIPIHIIKMNLNLCLIFVYSRNGGSHYSAITVCIILLRFSRLLLSLSPQYTRYPVSSEICLLRCIYICLNLCLSLLPDTFKKPTSPTSFTHTSSTNSQSPSLMRITSTHQHSTPSSSSSSSTLHEIIQLKLNLSLSLFLSI